MSVSRFAVKELGLANFKLDLQLIKTQTLNYLRVHACALRPTLIHMWYVQYQSKFLKVLELLFGVMNLHAFLPGVLVLTQKRFADQCPLESPMKFPSKA